MSGVLAAVNEHDRIIFRLLFEKNLHVSKTGPTRHLEHALSFHYCIVESKTNNNGTPLDHVFYIHLVQCQLCVIAATQGQTGRLR
jgi:hypothetical protein